MAGQRKEYGENKLGGGIKRSIRIYLRREGCGSCGRQVGTEINDWMQNRKHGMSSTQLREMQKRRSLLVFNTIKKTSFLSNACQTNVYRKSRCNWREIYTR